MKEFSYDEAFQASLNYFNGDDLATKVWLDKYALKNNGGKILEDTPDKMHWRLAEEFHRIEKNKFKTPYSKEFIFDLLDQFRFIIPQGSILFGCGNPYQTVSLSNCYVIESPCDSYGGILRADQHLVQISKRRGGTGTDLSKLRPKGFVTKNAAKSSTGIVSWMKRYSNSIREVGQDGRRGALMLTLSVHHPDIIDFITIKNNPLEVTGANISVRLSNEFLTAVENNTEYELRFPVDSHNVIKKVFAKDIFNKIVHSAWLRAEPGLLFWDDIVNYNAIDCYEGFETTSTNPCSELPLCPNDSCRLMLLNLFSYVKHPFTSSANFDRELFFEHTKIAQRLMDDIIDLELEKITQIIHKICEDPEPKHIKSEELILWENVYEKCRQGRRTGLGITGLGDTLAALGKKYDSRMAELFVNSTFTLFKMGALESSCEMAKELGPFPLWDWNVEKDSLFLLQLKEDLGNGIDIYNDIAKYGRRNIGHLTIAPTGSMSILTQTSSGIEPLFRLNPYKRRKKVNAEDKNARIDFTDQSGDCWQEFEVFPPKVKMWMDITGETDLVKSPWYGCCAEDIDWDKRVKIQGIIQKHIDHAISSTINLPENVSEKEVEDIYIAAWKNRLKGITVYRNNCRTGVLIDAENNKKKRPKKLKCDIHHLTVKGKKYYAAVGLAEDGAVYEIFTGENGCIEQNLKTGFIQRVREGKYTLVAHDEVIVDNLCELCSDEEESIARLTSISLRNSVNIKDIVNQLEKTKGNLHGFTKAMVRVLRKYIPQNTTSDEDCPECGNKLLFQEGCKKCLCGYSKC